VRVFPVAEAGQELPPSHALTFADKQLGAWVGEGCDEHLSDVVELGSGGRGIGGGTRSTPVGTTV